MLTLKKGMSTTVMLMVNWADQLTKLVEEQTKRGSRKGQTCEALSFQII
jgi:uncharacterized protein with GYD domain